MAKSNNDERIELFHEAASEYALNNIFKDDKPISKSELLDEIAKRVEDGEDQWDKLQKLIEGKFTKRFINALDALPDKDFVRNYLKLLEYFKPKLMRGELGDIEHDTVITLEVVQKNELGEAETIEIEGITIEEEQDDTE